MNGGFKLAIAAQTFEGSQGGIARVSELTARVALEDGYSLSLLSVQSEGGNFQNNGLWYGCRGSRTRFVYACFRSALLGARVIFDQLGTARAQVWPSALAGRTGSWIHGIEVWDELRPDRLRAAYRLGWMIANTNFTKERACSHDKVFETARVCWLATWEDEPPAAFATLEGPPTVLIVGRLDSAGYKGHRELIEAWPAVVGAVPKARLVIVGTGPSLEKHRALAASSRAAAFIEIAGFVAESDMPRLWQRAVIFAMPSRGEGFGLAYIEAMRWGVPVIASVHDAGQEINVHGETGFNVDLRRVGELADALIGLLRDRSLAQRMGAAGLRRWRTYFRYSAFRQRFSEELRRFVTL